MRLRRPAIACQADLSPIEIDACDRLSQAKPMNT